MKNKGRKTVTIYYNLKPGQSERSKTTNKKLVGKLLMQEEPDRNLFVYPVRYDYEQFERGL